MFAVSVNALEGPWLLLMGLYMYINILECVCLYGIIMYLCVVLLYEFYFTWLAKRLLIKVVEYTTYSEQFGWLVIVILE